MPSQNPHLVALRGDDAYARFLDRLLRRVRAHGTQIETRHQLAEHAIAVLALGFGLTAPPRARPVGTNQHGEPKKQA
jgi:hypothetical protein